MVKVILSLSALEAIGVEGHPLSESGDYYLKASVCHREEGSVNIHADITGYKTAVARGPQPNFERSCNGYNVFRLPIDMECQFVCLEVKERNLLTSNTLIGTALLTPNFLTSLINGHAVDVWLPLKNRVADDSKEYGDTVNLHVVLAVPELKNLVSPTTEPKSVKVVGSTMNKRKLQVTVFEVTFPRHQTSFSFLGDTSSSQASEDELRTSYVTIHTALNPAEEKSSHHQTKTIKESVQPDFYETFELFAELSRVKVLVIRLHEMTGRILKTAKCTGVVIIPLTFFLTSPEVTELDEVLRFCDPIDFSIQIEATIHIKLQVKAREKGEESLTFFRTESLQAERVDESRTRQSMQVAMENIQSVLVDDAQEDDDDHVASSSPPRRPHTPPPQVN